MQLYIRIFNHEEIEMAMFRVIKCFGLGLNHILGVEERVVLWLCFAKCNSLTQNHSYFNLVSVRLWGGTLSVCWIELHPSLWVIFRLETKRQCGGMVMYVCTWCHLILWLEDFPGKHFAFGRFVHLTSDSWKRLFMHVYVYTAAGWRDSSSGSFLMKYLILT